jgi:hypothetical protein
VPSAQGPFQLFFIWFFLLVFHLFCFHCENDHRMNDGMIWASRFNLMAIWEFFIEFEFEKRNRIGRSGQWRTLVDPFADDAQFWNGPQFG